jgi:hypothetical protein
MANLSNINGKFVVEQTTGYVGVGTTDPNFLIEAAGANSEIALNSTSASIYRLRSTSSDSFIITKNGVGDRLVIDGSGNATFAGNVRTTGAVNFYNSTSHYGSIYADSEGLNLDTVANRHMIFKKASVEVMRISTSGNVGIGTTSPTEKLHVEGNIEFINGGWIGSLDGTYWQRIRFEDATPTTTNAFNFETRNGSGAFVNHMTILNNGNVGIGTTTPGVPLEISNAGTELRLRYSATTYTDFRTDFINQISAGANSWHFKFNSSPLFTIQSTGNVGIGNTSPSNFNSLGGKQVVIGDGTQTNNLTLYSATTGGGVAYGHIAFADSNVSGSTAQYAGLIQYYHGNDSMQFYTNATPRFTVLNDGKFGIGTTTPSSLLTLNKATGEVGILLEGNGTDVAKFKLASAGVNHAVQIGSVSNNEVQFHTANSEKMRLAANGNVGIGETSPDAKLNVTGVSGGPTVPVANSSDGIVRIESSNGGVGLDIGAQGASPYSMWMQVGNTSNSSGDTYPILLNPLGGNVGIGTTSPANKLDVKISTGNRTTLEPVMSVSANGNGPYTGFGPKISFSSNIYYGAGTGNPAGIIETAYIGAVMGVTYATNSDLVFATRDGATSVTEKMRIFGNGDVGIGTTSPRAKLEVAGDITIQNGVYTYKTSGYTSGATAISVDITVGNEGGGGNVFKIEAGFAHYYAMTYNSVAEWWCTSRGTAVVNTYILNAGTTLAGDWSASKPSTTVLRITKSAGTYGGGGKWWIKVTYVPF